MPRQTSFKLQLTALALTRGKFPVHLNPFCISITNNTHRYWDVEVNPGVYSYTQAALSAGYSIFIYDRLGTGLSDKPDAYDIVQTSVQVDILRALTTFARSGQLLNSTYTRRISTSGNVAHIKDDWKPTKVIHVGHSLGSIITASLLSQTGGISDGAILTGFLFNTQMGGASPATWGFEYARENDPHKFGDRGSGYVVQARRSNVQSSFFKKGKFEPGLLDYAYEIRQPNTVTEFLSIGEVLANLTPNTAFTGPIQVSSHAYYDPSFWGETSGG